MTSNLPDAPERGKFTVQCCTEIEAPIEVVWKILLDFPSYHEWYGLDAVNFEEHSHQMKYVCRNPFVCATPYANMQFFFADLQGPTCIYLAVT